MSLPSPFVGAFPFDTADRKVFHGRAGETAALSALWRERLVIILYGPAGVGKTSLLRAGVLPALDTRPDLHVLPVGTPAFPAAFPLAALPDLNPFTFALLSSWFPDEPPIRISGSSIRGMLGRRSVAGGRQGAPISIFASIDETDLLFLTANRWARHRRRFAAELVEAVRAHGHLRLLMTIRAEHLDELRALLSQAGLPDESVTEFPLGALDQAAARQAITMPLNGSDHPLAVSARRLVDELAPNGAGVDPLLLQVVCRRLWDMLPAGRHGPIEPLGAMVDRVLGEHCLDVLATVAGDFGDSPGAVAVWFKRAFARRRATWAAERPGAAGARPMSMVRALEDSGLLRAERRLGRRRYRLRQARLHPVVRDLDPKAADAARPGRPRLDAAEAAFTAGETALARRRAAAVADEPTADARRRAAAGCLLGTLAYEEGRLEAAAGHYEAAATAFGALGDTTHVGMALAAVGRLKIGDGTTEAVNGLNAALTRLPGDPFVKMALAHALWYAGRTQAAIGVLDDTLSQDGSTPEALRLRGELLADLDRAEPALRDLDRVNYQDRLSSLAAWALAKRTCEGAGTAPIAERKLADDADDSGPVLLRVARVLQLGGDAESAADLAARAVNARRPPLPRHLHKEARRLMAR
jgi:tetratricopeptide (TPR) repeat protein